MYTQRTFVDTEKSTKIEIEDRVRITRDLIAEYQQNSSSAFESRALNTYFTYFISELGVNIETSEKENDYLWNEVLNNTKWFVSPRGDRFRHTRDPQLRDINIEYLTFSIDKQYPREHKVEIKILGIDEPIYFWLDTHQNLLNKSRQSISADLRFKTIFANVLLKRLYAITSGFLGRDEPEFGSGEQSRQMEYKRAHYRYLTSTTNHSITMESHGAQVHAKEIKDDYGIDIFTEIRRRRTLGTLKPNEYLTFVRETTPEHRSVLILPNELKFNPELVNIPIEMNSSLTG